MKIKEIFISNLFGLFNHRIDFKLGERITIIHGPNSAQIRERPPFSRRGTQILK